MRWIVASLALANGVMLIYFLFADSHQTYIEQPVSHRARGNLVLLSEREKASQLSPSLSTIDNVIAAGESFCTLIGPFSSLLRAEYFTERLATLDVAANIKELTVSTGLNHWVHLKPEISRKAALRRFSELQKKGIDSYIIPTGKLANGISLGIFTVRERAITEKERIVKNGYNPEIMEVPRQQQQIWVFLTPSEASAIDDETWLDLLVKESTIEKRKNVCSELLI